MVHTNEEHVSYLSHSAQPQIPVVFVMFVWPYLQPDWFSPPTVTLLLDLLHAMTHWWPHCCCYTSGFCLLKTEECWLRMFFFFFFLVSHTVDVNGLEMNCFRAGYLIMFFFLAPTQVWCLLSLMSWNSWQVWVHTSLCYSWSYHQCLHASVSWTCESLWCVFFVADLTSAVSSGLHVASLCVFSLGFSAATP